MNRLKLILLALSCALSGTSVFSQDAQTPAAPASTAAPAAVLPARSEPHPTSSTPVSAIATDAVAVKSDGQATATAKPIAAKASTAAFDPAARNIRFQFDGLSYDEVLERFAQMANKALVTDTNLQWTLTFNDPTPYSYSEALDT